MRALILTLLAIAPVAGGASAQSACTEDCRYLVQEAVRAVADRHEVPLFEVLVDTTGSGYRNPGLALRPGEETRPVSRGDFTTLASDLGVGLRARENAWSCAADRYRCAIEGAAMLVRFEAPVIEGDHAYVFVVAGYGVDSDFQEGRIGMSYFARFVRENGAWRFQRLDPFGTS